MGRNKLESKGTDTYSQLEWFEGEANFVAVCNTCQTPLAGLLRLWVFKGVQKTIYSQLPYNGDLGGLAILCEIHHSDNGHGRKQHNVFTLKSNGKVVGNLSVKQGIIADCALDDEYVRSLLPNK